MSGFAVGYLLGRKKERTIQERQQAVLRFAYEQERRARDGLPPLPMEAHPLYVAPARPWITGRGLRRAAVALVVLLLLLMLAFVVFAIGYGVQHHLIYPAGGR